MADLTLPPEGRSDADPEAAAEPLRTEPRRRKRPKLRTMEEMEDQKELHRDFVDVSLKPGVTVKLGVVNRRIEELAKNLDVALRVVERLGDTEAGARAVEGLRARAERIVAELGDLEAERQDLEAAADEALARFEFLAIGRVELRKLMRRHPPDDEAREEWDADMKALGQTTTEPLQFHPDDFPAALMARSAVEPEMTYEQAMKVWTGNRWEAGTAALIYGKCWEVNNIAP